MESFELYYPSLTEWTVRNDPYAEAFMNYPTNLIFKDAHLGDIYWITFLDKEYY